MGAAFGGGASQTLFGSSGAGGFLSKATTAAAIIFMLTSFTLAYISSQQTIGSSVLEGESDTSEPAPAAEGQEGTTSRKPEASSGKGEPQVVETRTMKIPADQVRTAPADNPPETAGETPPAGEGRQAVSDTPPAESDNSGEAPETQTE